MDKKGLKILGLVTTIVGAGVSLVSNWVGDKKQEQIIDEKVNEALTKRLEEQN